MAEYVQIIDDKYVITLDKATAGSLCGLFGLVRVRDDDDDEEGNGGEAVGDADDADVEESDEADDGWYVQISPGQTIVDFLRDGEYFDLVDMYHELVEALGLTDEWDWIQPDPPDEP